MHKDIVEAIQEAITHGNKKELLRIFVLPQETAGFWQMCIIPKEKYKHLLPHIELIGKQIGSYYGEGLVIEKTKSYIIFN